ncbi:MAG: hypothetical protein JWP37_1017, partial [Mucilaginibacter sp.]|nr:hypothetical protein [Mucilaginibacter sp.]
GKVINHADKKSVPNANVFLSNASVGDKTNSDGIFTLTHAKPGKYNLVVSIVGFETYHQAITVNNTSIALPDIEIRAKSIALQEVSIKPTQDPDRGRNYEWFKDEFLGTSDRAKDCKILNPEVLNLDYDDANSTLSASSYDFLIVENKALGYRVKYLLSSFIKDKNARKLHFEGSVLFEELKGTPAQQRRWLKSRQEVYEGSQMHFLRSVLSNRLDEEGFRVLQYASYENPERPPDSLIDAKIAFYKKTRSSHKNYSDSLADWTKKSKRPKILKKLMSYPLQQADVVQLTDQKGIYALGCEYDALHITYNEEHHFPKNGRLNHLDDRANKETTIFNFNEPFVLFDRNGGILNLQSFSQVGAWGWDRVAELLPLDYEPLPKEDINTDTTKYLKNVLTKLSAFKADHITEKAYLQFDKPYYAAGDTIYFKAYVTMGEKHELSTISGVLHVDLINTNSKTDQSIKLQLVNGTAWGDFALPDSLPAGSYRLRAYTNWMLNDGVYFDQTLPIGSVLNNKIPESAKRNTATPNAGADLQFFPEGGQLVMGIPTKIAFKAIGVNGLGMEVKGVIVDNDNKKVANLASSHLGMGCFYVTPQENKSYRAKLTYAGGTQSTINLPTANDKGITLSVNNDSLAKASVRITANKNFFEENKNKDFPLLIYSGGIATTVNCKLDSAVITLGILKRHLHTGIATVTLFSPLGEPLCERLIFIQNYDQLSLNISSDKFTYGKREKVNIKLNARSRADSAAKGNFSVSVTDESKLPVEENNENTILTDLLLSSDLKGDVEQPGYYFAHLTPETQTNLDILLLTQGYRKFEWKKLLNNEYPPIAYKPETGLSIAGTAKSLLGKPIAKGTVSLISLTGGPVLTQTTDDKGNFHFSNLVFMDTAKFVLQAVNAKGKSSTQLSYQSDKTGPVVTANEPLTKQQDMNQTMPAYLEIHKQQWDNYAKYGGPKGHELKEVKIKAVKRNDDYPSSSLAGPGHADVVIHAEQIENMGGFLSLRLQGKTRGLIYWVPKRSGGFAPLAGGASFGKTNFLIILDGYEINDIDDVNPQSVETVEVLFGANASIYGIKGGNGAIVITTKQGKGLQAKDIASTGILPITAKGFYKAREFYAPKYDAGNLNSQRADLRTTIYWQPELVTDKEGNVSFDYYNADGTGNYRVTIEGIDDKGNLGRRVYRYKVEN